MKQVLQNLRDGTTEVAEVPAPGARPGHLLIRTRRTLVSAGTERMLVDFGKANIIEKARQQPDKVRMVLDKVKADGLIPTIEAVRNKLDQPLPLGYSNVGTVIEVGSDVVGFAPGDRVASNGHHAEIVSAPQNLSAKVPEGVSDEAAAFTVVGAIALQGIRLAQPSLGETVAVTGLGLIGLISVQLLRAHGCRVLGLDFDKERLKLARELGAEVVDLAAGADPVRAAQANTRGNGVDGVIITASTKSSEPVHQAALMCRKRGRIVLVGVSGLELSRADFYEKELTFQVSCSYGPGRYDANYEQKGLDYPIGFVRWTEQRNFEAVLDMLAEGRLNVEPLISHRFKIGEAEHAYEVVGGSEPSLGVVLEYPDALEVPEASMRKPTVSLVGPAITQVKGDSVSVGFIGAGNYAMGVLIPAFKAAGATLRTVASRAGVSGAHAGRKHGFQETTTDIAALLEDEAIDAVVITTRHDSHANLVVRALAAGKHVFVEKPLCLTLDELTEIESAYRKEAVAGRTRLLAVGFNRRFAPQIQKIKGLVATIAEPKSFVMTVNAGAIPVDHWTQDRDVGGGRIVGEACHFIDLLRFLAASPVKSCHRTLMATKTRDTVSLNMVFENGSIGAVHYFANGPKSFPKERLEVFAAGAALQLDNFRRLQGFGWPGFKKMNPFSQDKGQHACAAAFINALKGRCQSPVPADEVFEISRLSIEMA